MATLTATLVTALATATPAHAECSRVEVAYAALGSPEKIVVDDANCVGPLRNEVLISHSERDGDPDLVYVRFYFQIIEPI